MKTCLLFLTLVCTLLHSCKKDDTCLPLRDTQHKIISFSPDSANIGDTVTITGANFDTSQGGSIVKVNKVLQEIVSVNDSVIIFKVVEGTVSGHINLFAKEEGAASMKSLVIKAKAQLQMHLTSFAPDSASVGDTIWVKGRGFNLTPAQNNVNINGVTQEVLSSTDSTLSFKVASGTINGKIVVTNNGYTATSLANLVIKTEGPWKHKSNVPVELAANTPNIPHVNVGIGVTVGNRGFIFKHQLWEYLPDQDLWIKKANKPKDGNDEYSFCFVLDNKIYVGYGGYSSLDSVRLWSYDVVADTWEKKNNMPISPRVAPFGFAVNGVGYAGCGQKGFSSNMHLHDFWKYNDQSDSWAQMTDFPGPWTIGISGLVINNEAFIYDAGLGFPQAPTAGFSQGRLWQYIPATNTWVEKATCPGGNRNVAASSFTIGGKGYYVITNTDNSSFSKDNFWMYDPVMNKWTQRTDVEGGGVRWFASAFAIGNKGYVGMGNMNYTEPRSDFWEYTPE